MNGEDSSTFGSYLDSFTRGVGTIASAINRPRPPASPNAPKPNYLPWAIGGGVVLLLLVIVVAVTGRR